MTENLKEIVPDMGMNYDMSQDKHYWKAYEDGSVGFYLNDHPEYIANPDAFHEISYEDWQALLDGQSQGKEIRVLKDTRTIGLYQKAPYPEEGGIKLVYNYDSDSWEETATMEETVEYYDQKVMQISTEINQRSAVGMYVTPTTQQELEKYKKLYMDAVQELAIEMNSSGQY